MRRRRRWRWRNQNFVTRIGKREARKSQVASRLIMQIAEAASCRKRRLARNSVLPTFSRFSIFLLLSLAHFLFFFFIYFFDVGRFRRIVFNFRKQIRKSYDDLKRDKRFELATVYLGKNKEKEVKKESCLSRFNWTFWKIERR